ncbi:MAG: polymer-forming cytoskeletal protein [Candidatus Kryptoniota bacterium]
MEKNKKNDLRINGLGSSSGGNYNFVQINGKGDVNGDLDCDDLQINGLGCIHGNVKSGSVKVAGKSQIAGNLKGEEIIIDGMAEISGGVSAEKIENRGMLRISKDCGSETFRSQGAFTIGGLLNAGKIEIETYAASRAREIGGEEIEIRAGDAFGFKKFISSIFPRLQLNSGLSAEAIEGDNLYLENVSVKVVRGRDVNIGPGCEIDKVEYKNTFHQDRKSSVKENKKV